MANVFDFRNSTFQQFTPYIPGEQPSENGWIKLNTNELPYPPSPAVALALQEIAKIPNLLRRYSHPLGEPLRSELARFWRLRPEQVLVTNGSDEALLLICRVFLDKDDKAAFSQVTYSLYKTLVTAVEKTFIETPPLVKKDNPMAVNLQALENSDAKVIFLPNPNAPTGEFFEPQFLKECIANSKKLWVIDEAYNDFVLSDAPSLIPLLNELPNTIVVRTFSKSYALAGMRLGYALASNPLLMHGLYSAKDSYNVDVVSARVGTAALQDQAYFHKTRLQVIEQREFLQTKLQELGFALIPSQANCILAAPPQPFKAQEIWQKLREHKILLRYFDAPLLENYLRISVGSCEENHALAELLQKFLEN